MNSTASIDRFPRRISDTWRTPDGRGLNGPFDAVMFWPHTPDRCKPTCTGKTFFFSVFIILSCLPHQKFWPNTWNWIDSKVYFLKFITPVIQNKSTKCIHVRQYMKGVTKQCQHQDCIPNSLTYLLVTLVKCRFSAPRTDIPIEKLIWECHGRRVGIKK